MAGQMYVVLDGHLAAHRSVPSTDDPDASPAGSPAAATAAVGGAAGAAGAAPFSATAQEGGSGGTDAGGAGGNGGSGGGSEEVAVIGPGSLVSCAAFLSSTSTKCKVNSAGVSVVHLYNVLCSPVGRRMPWHNLLGGV